jgi:hypothetical protein
MYYTKFILYTLCIISLSVPVQQISSQTPAQGIINEPLKNELLEMGKKDQSEERFKLMELMKQGIGNPEIEKQIIAVGQVIEQIDKENVKRLEEIITEYGWPGTSLVGKEAASAAFLILQHAKLPVQKKYFRLLKEAADKKEIPGGAVAMLEDRILMNEGKQQIYGSQVVTNKDTGKLELWPIADEKDVDRRRAVVGLPPLAEYLKKFNLEYPPPPK